MWDRRVSEISSGPLENVARGKDNWLVMLFRGWAGPVALTQRGSDPWQGMTWNSDSTDLDFKPSWGMSVLGFLCVSGVAHALQGLLL